MDFEKDYNASKLTPKRAMAMLREEGLDVSPEQAAEILYILRKLATIAMINHLK